MFCILFKSNFCIFKLMKIILKLFQNYLVGYEMLTYFLKWIDKIRKIILSMKTKLASLTC